MSTPADRPAIPMSQEEHGVLSRLSAAIEMLTAGQKRTEETLSKFIDATGRRFDAMAEREQFSWGKLATFLVAGVTMAGGFGAIMSMYIGTTLAPIQTQNQVSIHDREELHRSVDDIKALITAGKDARLEFQHQTDVSLAVARERSRENYYALHGHYPSTP